jgi:hypothetical protein
MAQALLRRLPAAAAAAAAGLYHTPYPI